MIRPAATEVPELGSAASSLRAAHRSARALERDGALALLERLADDVDAREGEAARSKEIARLAGLVADTLAFDPDRRSRCVVAARLHDLGKLKIPAEVLLKPGPLTREEWAVIETHPERGAALLREIPGYGEIADIVLEHHERHNGLGYPAGKRGDEICLEARIIGVCAAWSAMRSDRPHRPALSVERALAELRIGAGGQFDPAVVDAFFEVARREHLRLIELAQPAS